MTPRSVLRAVLGQLPMAAAIGLALVVIAVLRGQHWPGVVAAIGTAGAVAGLPLIGAVHGPNPPSGYRLPGYRRPVPVPTGRWSQGISALIVMIMIFMILFLPGWLVFLGMLLAWLGLLINLVTAYLRRRGRPRHREVLHRAVAAYRPRFVIYTGRRNDASYQLAMWVPILERLQLPYLVALSFPEALASTRAITKAPIVLLPTGSDLDAIMVPGLRAAFYVNGIAENSTLVNYRNLTHIYLGHGDSDKELSVHPMHGMFDRVFVAGQAAIDRYGQAGVKIPASKFVIVGRPQTAGLRGAGRPIGEVDPPSVLYAPTWRGYNAHTTLSSLPVGPAVVDALLRRGVVVSFRPHPFSWLGARERSEISAIDDLLRRDRDDSGRPHRTAAEHRNTPVAEEIDFSDALVTDIGSVLVDYFATGKPYAVVLPPGQSPTTARTDLPSTAAAYLISYDTLIGGPDQSVEQVLDELLVKDPLAGRRPAVARHYLGEQPGDDRPFLDAVRRVIGHPEPAR
ncbi:CDP-glycerol glycerophosphotransferase family protein [Microlunatus sp. Gsoil 973]|uniref:CDP-glycerol glycerophosphotransferase family protein n=1 Tax=Microlunatus sp. Gsoil 973 TaxID=2672569 RepID=UPI0012B46678|nr:CDP-glycerol glycerophosphotransferase family protein [Microlunatus sp. Gsoil 973]QGN32464.1 hypothetical protein GJV80_06235 [Microlunatus sp. Gsoil 973]